MVKVYRPDGTEEEMDTVDARECVAHCEYRYEPPVLANEVGEATDKASVAKPKKGAD